jgi:hypothetical protein
MRIETKPLQPADTDNNDDDTPTYLEADTQRTIGIPRAAAKVHYTTTKTTKVYIHYKNVLNRVAATSAAASSSILYPKKTVCAVHELVHNQTKQETKRQTRKLITCQPFRIRQLQLL